MDVFAEWLTPFLTGGSLLALPLVVLGGLITAFNPCCLPMYPAVFGFIGGACCDKGVQSSAECDRPASRPVTGVTLLFVAGMATATSIMGLLTAGLGWVFGRFDSPFLLLLAAVPLAMGLHMMNLFPLRLPAWTGIRLGAISGKTRNHGLTAFGAGLMFSLAIAPCATPILLGILTLVAMQGDLFYGATLMFIYGLGAGLPLLLIGYGFERCRQYFSSPAHQRSIRYLSGTLLVGVSIYIAWTVP